MKIQNCDNRYFYGKNRFIYTKFHQKPQIEPKEERATKQLYK